MPNWCFNELTIYSDDVEKVGEVLALFAQDEPFQAILPMPEDVAESLNTPGPMPAWYNWRVDNWGTKWDIEPIRDVEPDEWTQITFDTAWAPPEGIIDALRERFPEVDFTLFFREDGMQMAGYY